MSYGVPLVNPLLTSPSLPGQPAGQHVHSILRAVGSLAERVRAAGNTLAVWHRRHRDRRHLANLQCQMLRDIGLSFSDVEAEIAKPFWQG
jgi:uncharacterized protein YjiS (DUF1127 family)